MRRGFLWAVVLCLWFLGCEKRKPDIIRSIVAVPAVVCPGGSAVISVDANRRPSGATATGGTIATPVSGLFLWVAPLEEGEYQLTVQVGKAIATLTLPVRESEDKEPPQPPPQVFARSRCVEYKDSGGQTRYACTIILSWLPATDNVGVTGYRVYRDGWLYFVSVGNQFVDEDVKVDRRYTYGVQAFDAVGNASETVSVRIKVE